MSTCSFTLLCLNDLRHSFTGSSPNALVFAGKAAPDFRRDGMNWQCHTLKGDYKLRWIVAEAGMFPLNPPVTSSISSKVFQTRQLTHFESECLRRRLVTELVFLSKRTVTVITVIRCH